MNKKMNNNGHNNTSLSRRCQNVQNFYETFIKTKIPFLKRAFLDHRVQNEPEISSKNFAALIG